MSGAEVGLVLSILPLLISAAEHYKDVLRPFKRFKNYAIELRNFKDELSSEQRIFDTEMTLLLAPITSFDVAEEMVENQTHCRWKDSQLELKLSQRLGTSKEACIKVIGLIDDDLNKIREESQFFTTVTSESVTTNPVDKDSWRERIGRKLKFSLSQSHLQDRLKDLRRHVKLFQRHTSQVNRVNDKRREVKEPQQIHLTTEIIDKRRFVQEAAAELYQALMEACQMHHQHTLHFRLTAIHSAGTGRPLIRFDMAFIQRTSNSDMEAIWVAVESERSNSRMLLDSVGRENVESLRQTTHNQLKRTSESTPDSQSKKQKASVHLSFLKTCNIESSTTSPHRSNSSQLESISSRSRQISRSTVSETPFHSTDLGMKVNASIPSASSISSSSSNNQQAATKESSLPDFCQQRNLCNQIIKWSKTSSGTTDACIGYLGSESATRTRVLVTQQVDTHLKTPTSLAEVITSNLSRPRSSRFLYIDSIRFAKELASAILVFHATPILRDSWQSEDIVFYEPPPSSNAKAQQPRLIDPHLNVHITSTEAQNHIQTLPQAPPSPPQDRQIRNFHTYRLGVILLELACQAPFSRLREEEDEISSPENPSTDFEVANFISKTLSTDMGISFQNMVQKCLNCDFGYGTDLGDLSLQTAFHKDVVCELAGIESRLSALQLGE